MNPYCRFLVVSNAVSAAIVLALVCFVFGPATAAYSVAGFEADYAPFLAAGAALLVTIVVWLALTDAVLPFFFRYTPIRKLVLGKHYMEGTWIQAEKHNGMPRMAVIEIQPAGKSFRFSGYAVDENLEVQSNVIMEFSSFSWPFMTYKFRNSLADTSEEGREGVGELHFEANRHAPRSYNGFVQTVNSLGRVKIEGVRLMKGREIRDLRSLEYRADIIDKYWGLFFERGNRVTRMKRKGVGHFGAHTSPVSENVVDPPKFNSKLESSDYIKENEPVAPNVRADVERHVANLASENVENSPIVPRRRASDWSKSDEALEFTDLDDFLDDPDLVKGAGSMELSGSTILRK
ncbi:hypothetical protein [Hirschia baltica]|uniref:Uncharacterized protein n=1 Tax=Hirschia baltica (strain ATCC 49814 / DSM 5838 / IFAM 1418) TaxID=582402 RepID=C6XM33_HIRBI|nr:hypothetical protein [Hirschia baltica]ACT59865.1 hypothetical protein Hbal_2184 [Hirschia baltica ATCC 49814]